MFTAHLLNKSKEKDREIQERYVVLRNLAGGHLNYPSEDKAKIYKEGVCSVLIVTE